MKNYNLYFKTNLLDVLPYTLDFFEIESYLVNNIKCGIERFRLPSGIKVRDYGFLSGGLFYIKVIDEKDDRNITREDVELYLSLYSFASFFIMPRDKDFLFGKDTPVIRDNMRFYIDINHRDAETQQLNLLDFRDFSEEEM